jgi:WhiB family redox-sensing transcriptional regulator
MPDRWQPVDLTTDLEAHDWTQDPAEVLTALSDLLKRPAWHARAACRGKGTSLFFLDRGQSSGPAREVCGGCNVKQECLSAALDTRPAEDFGVWAGSSARDRNQLRRTLRDEAA